MLLITLPDSESGNIRKNSRIQYCAMEQYQNYPYA
jgi:hypothetical protein